MFLNERKKSSISVLLIQTETTESFSSLLTVMSCLLNRRTVYQKAVQMLVLAVNQKVKPLLLVRINNK